ncbi:MAG: flavin monoamine oxidase family protein [Fulvimonas sp.]|nr:flavin monoamine oxidase family protein [Fulvimonas sp.]
MMDFSPTRRQLLRCIGLAAGSAAMYQAMSGLGLASESPFKGRPKLSPAPPGTSVLILGAGIAGMVAAYELQAAGYKVQILEYNARPGGRNWTLRGGDAYTELGGFHQQCQFDDGQYINPGPWRLPYHHHGILHYCKVLGVALEPFVQVNHNAYLHGEKAFGGKPQRYRHIAVDYRGHVAELLAQCAQQGRLDDKVNREDRERLLESLREWGALDAQNRYVAGKLSSNRRGYERDPGGGLSARPQPSVPLSLDDVLDSGLWAMLTAGDNYEMQTTLLQPVGGMGRIGEAFAHALGPIIRYRAKVVDIHQDEHAVHVTCEDASRPGSTFTAQADWCVNTIPLSILSQIPMNVGQPMADAIAAVPYAAAVKIGLQFKRRFWEEDEHIYGGISYTDLPITNISYPSYGFHGRKGVLLGAYMFGLNAMEFTAMPPDQRVRLAVEYGSRIHPQYAREFENGISVAWHRSPFTMGCFGLWSEASRTAHYDDLCQIDGRIVLAGEHASYIPAWQEGAVTSAIDAITRLHQRIISPGAAA